MSPKLTFYFSSLIVVAFLLFVLRLAAESSRSGILMGIFLILLWLWCVAVYFMPSVVAGTRRHANMLGLFWMNFFLGWTLLGWVAALVWALYRSDAARAVSTPGVEARLRTLSQLKSDGLISEQEFEEKRSAVLSSLAPI